MHAYHKIIQLWYMFTTHGWCSVVWCMVILPHSLATHLIEYAYVVCSLVLWFKIPLWVLFITEDFFLFDRLLNIFVWRSLTFRWIRKRAKWRCPLCEELSTNAHAWWEKTDEDYKFHQSLYWVYSLFVRGHWIWMRNLLYFTSVYKVFLSNNVRTPIVDTTCQFSSSVMNG